jgi:hypothetical protein
LWELLPSAVKEKGQFLDPACGSGVFLVRSFQRLCEHYIVPDLRVHVERQVRGVQVKAVIEQIPHLLILRAPDARKAVPDEAMVHDNHLAFFRRGLFIHRHARVNCQTDSLYGFQSLHLQSITGGVFDFFDFKEGIEVFDNQIARTQHKGLLVFIYQRWRKLPGIRFAALGRTGGPARAGCCPGPPFVETHSRASLQTVTPILINT